MKRVSQMGLGRTSAMCVTSLVSPKPQPAPGTTFVLAVYTVQAFIVGKRRDYGG